MEKKLDGNNSRMLLAILNKSWRQHPTKQQLYCHLPLITKTIQVRRTRHAGHCWRSRDELISDVLLWTPTHGQAKAGRPAQTYIQQLCEDTGYSPEDLPESMNDREEWRERVRDISAGGTTWWWWWYSKDSEGKKVFSRADNSNCSCIKYAPKICWKHSENNAAYLFLQKLQQIQGAEWHHLRHSWCKVYHCRTFSFLPPTMSKQ